jgi:hypothetical protein
MRRILKLPVLGLAVAASGACNPETIIETKAVPTAGVRFINAVPDTGAFDFRFVDVVENSAQWNQAFRNNPVISGTGTAAVPTSQLVQFKPAQAGQRHFKIFLNSTDAAVAQTVVKDTTVNLEAGKNYTALLWGNARGGATPMRLSFFEEAVPDPGTQVALRVINASGSPVDVRYYKYSGTVPATAAWSNVAPMTIASYLTTAPDTFRFNVQPAGGGTTLFTDYRALVGAAPVTGPPGPLDAQPGTAVAGSAVTAIIFPRSVAGSQAPQAGGSGSVPSYQAPAITFVWDRRPPRPPGT